MLPSQYGRISLNRRTTMNDWHFESDGHPEGPVAFDELKVLAQSGRIGRETKVWTAGNLDWVPAYQVDGLFASPPALAVPIEVARHDSEESPTVRHGTAGRPAAPSSAGPWRAMAVLLLLAAGALWLLQAASIRQRSEGARAGMGYYSPEQYALSYEREEYLGELGSNWIPLLLLGSGLCFVVWLSKKGGVTAPGAPREPPTPGALLLQIGRAHV